MTRTSQICLFNNEKQEFCTLCTCIFHFCTFRKRSCSFQGVTKIPVLALCGRVWTLDRKFPIWSSPSSVDSKLITGYLKTHFARIVTLNNCEMIEETRSYIFRCSRCASFNSMILRSYFASIMTSNDWEMIAETRSYIFRWRSRSRWCWLCLSSLLMKQRKGAKFFLYSFARCQ